MDGKGVTTNNLPSLSLLIPFVGRARGATFHFICSFPHPLLRIEQPSPLPRFETPSNLLLRTCLAFDPALPYCPH